MKDIKRQLRKESTTFVPNMRNEIYHSVGFYKKPTPRLRLKPLLSVALVFIITLLILIMPTAKANSYVIIEINPAIQLEVDKDDNLIAVTPLNADGYFLLTNDNFTNLTLSDAIIKITNLASKEGYLTSEDSKISISSVSKNKKDETQLLNKVQSVINNNVNAKVELTNDTIGKEAKTNNVSSGKMYLIKNAMAIDKNLTIEVARKMNIKELNEIITEHAKDEIEVFNDEYDKNIKSFNLFRNNAITELKNENKAITAEINAVKKLISSHAPLNFIIEKINTIGEKFINYESSELTDYDDCEDAIDDLEDEAEDYYEFVEEMIEEKYQLQKELYNDNVKEKLKIGRASCRERV